MKYNFDERIDRSNTFAAKRIGYKPYIFKDPNIELPFTDEEFIHLWVADMEFAMAPEIKEGIIERLDREILGYTAGIEHDLGGALNKWCMDRYDWSFNVDETVFSPGIVTGIKNILSILIEEDDEVAFFIPSYGAFATVCKGLNIDTNLSPLINDNGYYTIDFEDLEKRLADPKVKVLIFCNPYNPVGRAWTEDELKRVAELVKKYDKWVISDEIHCDLRRAETHRHIPLGKVMPDYDKLITCMSPSKSFNIAGLQESALLVRSEELRNAYRSRNSINVNPLSHAGTMAAYERGGEWLDAVNEYLDDNFKAMYEFFEEKMPETIVTKSETTYLGWVDFKNYVDPDFNLELFLAEKAAVLIESDKAFVGNAETCIRINISCPRDYMMEGLNRIYDAFKEEGLLN